MEFKVFELRCRECRELVDVEDCVSFHHSKGCYEKFLESYKEYGIRIGMRIHKAKKKVK